MRNVDNVGVHREIVIHVVILYLYI